jgi:hypothetical protein
LKGTSDIPIYEAKCSRDIRIVYQIDLYNNTEQKIQKQILKIWGIVSHAEMDNNRLWTAIANEMAGARSRTYKSRSVFVSVPANTRKLKFGCSRVKERAQFRKIAGEGISDMIDPLSFPRLVEQEVSTVKLSSKDLSESDWVEVRLDSLDDEVQVDILPLSCTICWLCKNGCRTVARLSTAPLRNLKMLRMLFCSANKNSLL